MQAAGAAPVSVSILTDAIVCGGLLAAGFAWAGRGHARVATAARRLIQADLLAELAARLRPLQLELRRWGEAGGAADAPPSQVDTVVFLAYDVERLWRSKLGARITSVAVHRAYERMHCAASELARAQAAERPLAAAELRQWVEALRAAIAAAEQRCARRRLRT